MMVVSILMFSYKDTEPYGVFCINFIAMVKMLLHLKTLFDIYSVQMSPDNLLVFIVLMLISQKILRLTIIFATEYKGILYM